MVAFHFARALVAPGLGARGLAAGQLAVDVFFVLSGFVLTERYRDVDVASGPALRAFAVRRFVRVYPSATSARLRIGLGHELGLISRRCFFQRAAVEGSG